MSTKTLLELRNFSVTFEKKIILNSINLNVNIGEFCVFTGPSGSGKTVTLRSICKLNSGYQGDITLHSEKPPGFVFQRSNLLPWLSVYENLLLCFPERKDEIRHWLNRLGLNGFECHMPNQISGGMQQKVALARALLFNSKFIVLDEPFSSLDFPQRIRLQNLLQELWLEQNATIIFVTHDIEEAIFLGQKIYLFNKTNRTIHTALEVSLPIPRNHKSILVEKDYQDLYRYLQEKLIADDRQSNHETVV